jgi:pimeloyl-ACP methyl ester carboxylesterase
MRRRVKPAVRAMRAYLAAASRVAPAVAERQAAKLFLTPRRKRRGGPAVSDASARPFTLRLDEHRLRGWSVGEGPLVLLVHGWEAAAEHMVPAAMRLAATGYRAVALDMPAHGDSSGRRTSLVEWVAVLRALPGVLGPPAAVVGHSFGATSLIFAMAEGMPADRAVLLAPPLGPMHFVERASRFMGLPATRLDGMVRRIGHMVGRDIREFDAARAAAAVSAPALIMHDPEDPDVPWTHAEAIASALPVSRLVASRGVGHYRILADPVTLEATTRFAVEGRAEPVAPFAS